MTSPITPAQRQTIAAEAEKTVAMAQESLDNTAAFHRSLPSDVLEQEGDLLNALEFVLLLQFDLTCLLQAFVANTGTLKGSLFGRLVLLTVHESLLTMRSLFSRQFRERMTNYLADPLVDDALRRIHSSIHRLFEESERRFGDVRNGIVAHRDASAARQLDLIEVADQEQIAALAIKMLQVIDELGPLMVRYTARLRAAYGDRSA